MSDTKPINETTGTVTAEEILSYKDDIIKHMKENAPISYDPELTGCYDEIAETFHHLGDLFTKLSTLER